MAAQLSPPSLDNTSRLPALLPPTAALLHQTQRVLGLLRDVVQESSAEYWYERGKSASSADNWDEAEYSFNKCITNDNTHWRGTLQLAGILSQQLREDSTKMLFTAFETPSMDGVGFTNELSLAQWRMIENALESYKSSIEHDFFVWLALAIVYRITSGNIIFRKTLDYIEYTYPVQVETSANWHYLSGIYWEDHGKKKKAIRCYSKTILLNP